MRLVLPVIYCKEESCYKLDGNIPLAPSDYIIKYVIFYTIDIIEPIINIDDQCIVTSSGSEFRINMPMGQLDSLIRKQRYYLISN